ncbi:transcription initiation factor TFIID subunit 11 [Polyrhizophydium stewartii]|uniref:Transcription initiation factor TFIID subunit 11 n=1 Tax=Polyrhizophydium stewartii TaxID=2732419 RepID=A0ABR4MXE7_9FUNG
MALLADPAAAAQPASSGPGAAEDAGAVGGPSTPAALANGPGAVDAAAAPTGTLSGVPGIAGLGPSVGLGFGGGDEEGGDEDEDDAEEQLLQMPATTEEDREAIKALLDTFSPDQLQRYEMYRRAHLPKAAVRKFLMSVVGTVPASAGIIVGGCAKLFVGEIVESALEFMEELGEPEGTPIRPDHIREAFRRYRESHPDAMNSQLHRKRLF